MKIFGITIFKKKPIWIYGTCKNLPARKHRKKGNVQFVLWKAGEGRHKEDFWINFHSGWWPTFIEDETVFKDNKS